jgi:hypothetical protein
VKQISFGKGGAGGNQKKTSLATSGGKDKYITICEPKLIKSTSQPLLLTLISREDAPKKSKSKMAALFGKKKKESSGDNKVASSGNAAEEEEEKEAGEDDDYYFSLH